MVQKAFYKLMMQFFLNAHKTFQQQRGMKKSTFLDFFMNTVRLMLSTTPQIELSYLNMLSTRMY